MVDTTVKSFGAAFRELPAVTQFCDINLMKPKTHPNPRGHTNMDTQKQRKRIYVDQAVQGGIVARLVVLWLASTMVAAGVWFLLEFFANPTQGFAYYLAGAWQQILPLVLSFAVTLPIAVLLLVRFTHRFVGPLVRLRGMMHDVARGREVPTLAFRENDYWHELAADFNSINEKLAGAKRRVSELEAQLAAAEPSRTNPTLAASN